MSNDKTISFRVSNGNGVEKTFTLSWWASLLSIVAVSLSLFFGVARGVAWAGERQIDYWFDKTAMPQIEKRIDEKVDKLDKEREIRLQGSIKELEKQVTRLQTIVDGLPRG